MRFLTRGSKGRSPVTARKLCFLALSVLVVSSVCFGSTNSCQQTTATSVAVAGQQTAGATIAAAGLASPNADDFNTLNTAASPGCGTVDMTFSNFTATITGINSAAGTYISTGANQNLQSAVVDAYFSNVR